MEFNSVFKGLINTFVPNKLFHIFCIGIEKDGAQKCITHVLSFLNFHGFLFIQITSLQLGNILKFHFPS
jgi:hypothetical protein